MGLPHNVPWFAKAIDLGALYLDDKTGKWMKPVLSLDTSKRLWKLMQGCVAASWPAATKDWRPKRLDNVRRALKHMVDVAFMAFGMHVLDSNSEQAIEIWLTTFFVGCCANG